MSKKQPPVCPYACPYEDMKRDRRGRKPSSPEAMRKQIDKALDLMFAAGDFWALETVRRTLIRLTLFDDAAFDYGLSLMHLNEATEQQHKRLHIIISSYLSPIPERRKNR